jgi:hypothetical protein
MIVLQVLVKTGYEITILPVTCQVALWVGKHEKIHSAGFVTPIGGHL